mmetsp:Transcript_52115/g.136175  ORF Transcript_52115/g.136175 Transcript_52115/m.136175 type:complete len:83 (+) Transcript_52115:131-379(+)
MGSAKNNNKGGHPWLPLSPDLARSRVALEPSRLSAGTAVSSTASWALELPFPLPPSMGHAQENVDPVGAGNQRVPHKKMRSG